MTFREIKTILPQAIRRLVEGYTWFDSSGGYSQTSTFRLNRRGESRFLKVAPISHWRELRSEKDRLVWLSGQLPVPEVLSFVEDHGKEFLLMSALPGSDASSIPGGDSSPDVVRLLAAGLRMVHEISIDQCPFDTSLQGEIERVRFNVANGLVNEAEFDNHRRGQSAQDLFEELLSSRPADEDLVFTHGDYCLPNVLIDGNEVAGFVDWSRAGVADRYKDIALVIRSLRWNLGEYLERDFFDVYGISDPDEPKIEYYMLLDEFW